MPRTVRRKAPSRSSEGGRTVRAEDDTGVRAQCWLMHLMRVRLPPDSAHTLKLNNVASPDADVLLSHLHL